MNSPRAASKVLLLSSPRPVTPGPAPSPLRRFRIARLRLDGGPPSDTRFAALKGG